MSRLVVWLLATYNIIILIKTNFMTLKFRRCLYISFFLLFFILAPIVIFYAQGYRFDLGRNRMVKTGGLSVDSTPRNAQVYLNGSYTEPNWLEKRFLVFKTFFGMRKMGGNTPAIFQNLVPDIYQIDVEKDGYYTWSKKVDVYSEQVTFLEDIYLFLKNPEVSNLKQWENVSQTWPSENHNLLAIAGQKDAKWNLEIANLTAGTTELVYRTVQKPQNCLWNNANDKILLTLDNQEQVLIDLTLTSEDKSSFIKDFNFGKNKKINFTHLAWSRDDRNLLYTWDGLKIYVLNIKDKTVSLALDLNTLKDNEDQYQKIYDLTIKDGRFWILGLTQKENLLTSFKINGNDWQTIIKDLDGGADYLFTDWQNNLLTLYNEKKSSLTIINPLLNKQAKILLREAFVKGWNWQAGNTQLLYWDNYELGILNFDLKNEYQPVKKEVLGRYSQLIKSAVWCSDNKYVIFGTDQGLTYLEIDARDHRNSQTILNTKELTNLISFGDTIFGVGSLEQDTTELYKVNLR